jgi:histidine triad (HIT) family protein
MPDDCIFCKIVEGEIPSEKIFENEHVIAFNDINPKAPTHILVVPKKHFATLNDVPENELNIILKIFGAIREIASKAGVAEEGYRVIVNTNRSSGQEVFHLHFHIMGGRQLGSMG